MGVETGGFTAGCGRLRGFVTLIYVVSPGSFSSLPKGTNFSDGRHKITKYEMTCLRESVMFNIILNTNQG